MYEKKTTNLTRKDYYLTAEQKLKIKDYMIVNPEMTQVAMAKHFGVSRTVIYNIQIAPTRRAEYEKKISELINQYNSAADKILRLESEIIKLKRL